MLWWLKISDKCENSLLKNDDFELCIDKDKKFSLIANKNKIDLDNNTIDFLDKVKKIINS